MKNFENIFEEIKADELNPDILYNVGGDNRISEVLKDLGVVGLDEPYAKRIRQRYKEIDRQQQPKCEDIVKYFHHELQEIMFNQVQDARETQKLMPEGSPRILTKKCYLRVPAWVQMCALPTLQFMGFIVHIPKLSDALVHARDQNGKQLFKENGDPIMRPGKNTSGLIPAPKMMIKGK